MDSLQPDQSVRPDFLSPLIEALSEERAATREQLSAAWQLYAARVSDALGAAQDGIGRLVEKRFAEVAARMGTEFENAVAARVGAEVAPAARKARAEGKREASDEFNRAVRRLRRHESEDDWAAALLDATAPLCRRAALFEVQGGGLKLLRAGPQDAAAGPARLDVCLADAPAFASAVESRDPVVAVRTEGELSEGVLGLLGRDGGQNVCLFPVVVRDRVAAVLCADGRDTDVSGLELLCVMAAAALEARATGVQPPLPLARVSTAARPASRPADDWSRLSVEDGELHLRARRFARVQVAEMRLYKSEAVRAGRAGRCLYSELQQDIDAGRETFRREFLSRSSSMVDYLHLELVSTLANDDLSILGEDYPGPLV
jgi:hypothetical protein